MSKTLIIPPAASTPKPEQGPESLLPPMPKPDTVEVEHPDPVAAAESEGEPKDTSPIQFMGGTLHDQEKNGFVLNYIQSTGRETLTPLPSRNTRGIPWRTRIHTDQDDEVVFSPRSIWRTVDEEVKAITSVAQENRAQELISDVEAQPQRTTLIGQSADAQPAVIAVHRRPDKFKNLILAFPSGIPKKQKRSEYLREGVSKLAKGKLREPKPFIDPEDNYLEPLPSSAAELGRLTMRRFKGSGGLRALASTMSGYQGGLLHELRQNKDAPGVSMVLGTRDPVGRPDRIIERLQSADDVDFLLIVNSGHGIKGRKYLIDKILGLTHMMEARTHAREAAESRGEKFDPGALADRLIFLDEESYRVPEEEQKRLKELARQVPNIL